MRPGLERMITPLPLVHMNAMAYSTLAMVLTEVLLELLIKLPPAASTSVPEACELLTEPPEFSVILPLLSNVALSTKENAPPTVIAPAFAAPIVMLPKPFLNTDDPLNRLEARVQLPLPLPRPIVVPAV